MSENQTSFTKKNDQEKEFDVKEIIYLLRRQWHWITLCGVFGLLSSYSYTKLTTPTYLANSTLLILEKSKGLDLQSAFAGAIDKPLNNIFNQIEIIKSYQNLNQTLVNLNWRTSWYKKEVLIWHDIYKKEPFDVQETQNFVNPSGIAIYITPISNDSYSISVNGNILYENSIVKVKFEDKGKYDRPFINKYFNFTLLKKINNFNAPKDNYYFVFNDINDKTLSYQNKVKVGLKGRDADIILCSVADENPLRASDFINEMIKVYSEGSMNFQSEAQRRSLDFINTQLTGISDSLNIASTKFTNFKSRNQIVDLGNEGKQVMDNLKEIETERVKNQMQLDYFQNLLKYLNNTSDAKQLVSPSVVGIQDVSLNALVMKLSELYNRRQILSFSATENNTALVLIDKEINQIRNQLNENLRNLIDNATRNLDSQKERQNSISIQLNKLPQKEQQMVNIQRQFNLTNEIYTFLLQKRAETNIALASSMPDVQIIDTARVETATVVGLPNKIILILGLILGLIFPLVLVLIKNFFDGSIRTQHDVEDYTKLPILGSIMHNSENSELTVYENPKSIVAESLRTVRTNILFMLNASNGKVISINSCNPGEGKSFITVNLGTILAMNNKQVLIIGGDIRKPTIHKRFKQSNEIGLSSYLNGDNTIDQIIFPTEINNLFILPSGPIPPNPAEMLSKPEMKNIINQVSKKYDYIIIDNAPMEIVADGFILSNLVDLNIFVLRYGVSQKYQVELINEYASKKIISNSSIIVNDIKQNIFSSSYYKNYRYETYKNSYYSDEKKSK